MLPEKQRNFLWMKTIVNNKNVKISNRKRYSIPCHSRPKTCCKQLKHTNTFSSRVTKRTYNIYYKLSYKCSYLLYLMECTLFKRKHTRKSETALNIRLHNHRNKYRKPICQKKTNILDYLVIISIDIKSLP